MTQYKITIPGPPTPWRAPIMKGKKFYNLKSKEKLSAIWHIKAMDLQPLEGSLKLDIAFYMPIPRSYTKKRKEELMARFYYHTKKPDRTNLQKFVEDCLELAGVIKNDSFVVEGSSWKVYSIEPRTEIILTEMKHTEPFLEPFLFH